MNNKNSFNNGLINFLKQPSIWIVACGTFLSFVYELVNKAQNNFDFILVCLLISIVALWLTCLYYSWFWKPEFKEIDSPKIVLSSNEEDKFQEKKAQQHKMIRKLSQIGFIVVPILFVLCVFSLERFDMSYSRGKPSMSSETFEICRNSVRKVRMSYPETWRYKELNNPFTGDDVVLTPTTKEIEEMQLKLVITCINLQEIETFDEYTNKHIKLIIQGSNFNKAENLEKREDILANGRALRITYEIHKMDLKITEILTFRERQVYLLTYRAKSSQYAKHIKDIEAIFNSFSLL
jgi:hypothetical protein